MDEIDRKFYQDRLDLFMTDGWLDLISELQTLEKSLNDVKRLDNEKDLQYCRGQLSLLDMLLTLEETTKVQMEMEEYE